MQKKGKTTSSASNNNSGSSSSSSSASNSSSTVYNNTLTLQPKILQKANQLYVYLEKKFQLLTKNDVLQVDYAVLNNDIQKYTEAVTEANAADLHCYVL